MSELATRARTDLAIGGGQEFWTEKQRAALAQMGVKDASNADLAVFFHVAARTGLDPFARQIYMIGRREKVRGDNGQDQWVTKQTIQTGIDGYRLVARRAADRAREKLSQSEPLWMDTDKRWHEAWDDDAPPRAAKVIVYRDGQPFPAVCSYREYVQTDRQGNPTSMWRRMPANQLAKCAEAAALRKAFPQELAGVYAQEEMGQADSAPRGPVRPEVARVSVDELTVDGEVGMPAAQPAEPSRSAAGPVEDDTRKITQQQVTRLILRLRDHNVETDDQQHEWLSTELGREVASRKDVTRGELARLDEVLDVLDAARGGDQPDGSTS